MFKIFAAMILTLPFWTSPAMAQDGMDLQRKVWRCQYHARDMSLSGAAEEAFLDRCLNGGSGPQRSGTRSAAAADGVWSYGHHPKLGLSAHVNTGGESMGLVCALKGVGLGRGDTVSFRMTPGISPNATKPAGAILFVDGTGGVYTFESNPGGFVELKENACGFAQSFQRGKSFISTVGTDPGGFARGKTWVTTLTQGGIPKEIAGEADVSKLTDVKIIPLKGSAAAIRKLINACPAMAEDFRNDCGV